MALTIPSIFTAIDQVTGPIQRMAASITGFANTSVAAAARASRGFAQIGSAADSAYKKLNVFPAANSVLGAAGITVGVGGAVVAMKKFVTEAAKMEDATASFQALLGGKEAAAGLVTELNKLGARTPFGFEDLAKASNMMIGFGAATKETVIPTLSMLGDVAQGNADKLNGITLAFSQIQAGGKASMQDVNQLVNNGVPILGQLAKQWKMTSLQARKAIEQGKGTSAEITKAFKAMTSEGGMFFKGMEIASGTFNGQMSTLQDTIDQTFAAIGTAALPMLKEYQVKIIESAGKVQEWANANKGLIQAKVKEWVEKIGNAVQFVFKHWDQIITGLKIYIGLLVFLKATSIASAIATNYLAIKTAYLASAQWRANAATKVATAYQWLLNAAMTANPIGLIIVGIAALIALVVVMIKHWDEWGAALSLVLGPLGMIISFAMSLYKNWKLVTEAFRNDGILGGIKAIGKVLLDAILAPLQQILEIAGNLPGKMGAWAKQGAANIEAFRNSMGLETASSNVVAPEAGFRGPINPVRAQQNAMITGLKATQEVKIEVATAPGTSATVTKNTGGKMPKTSSTLGQF